MNSAIHYNADMWNIKSDEDDAAKWGATAIMEAEAAKHRTEYNETAITGNSNYYKRKKTQKRGRAQFEEKTAVN